jgi:hypothetical protein
MTDLTLTYFLTEEYNPDSPDEHEWNALDKKWPGYKAWKIKRLRKFKMFRFSGEQVTTVFEETDLIRSKRDLDAPSLREFAAAW